MHGRRWPLGNDGMKLSGGLSKSQPTMMLDSTSDQLELQQFGIMLGLPSTETLARPLKIHMY